MQIHSPANIDGTFWLNEIDRLHAQEIPRQSSVKEIQYFCLNSGCLCGTADEPMCEIAIDIQKNTGNDLVFFGGYTNGYGGYFPSAEEYDLGGYEVLWSNLYLFQYYNRVMPFNRNSAKILAEAVSQKWKKTSIL